MGQLKNDKSIYMKIIHELNETHIKQLHVLYQNEWFTKNRTLEETRLCVLGSQICLALIDKQNNLQGFARVLTDYIFKALIFDVIVSTPNRKKGWGDKLMIAIQNHPKLLHVKHFELYCLPEMFAYYEKHGFSKNVGDIKLMRYMNK
ncbi:MAG: GNAT family N-acetyltransferase [Spirochaetia bacterium]|nr:GNAT family N-acetyltransferase [Spirochaetia bacterium]